MRSNLICLILAILLLGHAVQAQNTSWTELSQTVAEYERLAEADPESLEVHLKLGLAYLGVDATDKAIHTLTQATQLAPASYEASYWLGRAYYLREQYEHAVTTFQALAAIHPNRHETYSDWGMALLRLHEYEEAQNRLTQALVLMDQAPDTYRLLSIPSVFAEANAEWLDKVVPLSVVEIEYYLALASFERGKLDRSLRHCQRSLSATPSARAYFQLGLVHLRMRDLGQAEQAFVAALEIDPYLHKAHYQLALLAFRQGKKEDGQRAMEKFQQLKLASDTLQEQRRAIAHNTDKTGTLVELGQFYLQSQGYDKAAHEFEKALWHDPNSVMAHVGLAHARALQGRFAEAVEVHSKATEIAPTSPELDATLGFIWLHQAKRSRDQSGYKRALEAYRRAVDRKPDFAEAWLNRGQIALELTLLEEAKEALEKWLSFDEVEKMSDTAVVKVYLALAEISVRQEDLAAAENHYRQVLRRDPDVVEAYYNMGFIATKLGRIEQAMMFYEAALERKPDMAEAHYLVGKLYSGKQRYQDAETAYQRAIELDPSLGKAHERLAHFYGMQREHLGKAVELAHRAVDLEPESPVCLNTLSWLYYLQADYAKAEHYIRQALARQPENSTYQRGLEAILQATKGQSKR